MGYGRTSRVHRGQPSPLTNGHSSPRTPSHPPRRVHQHPLARARTFISPDGTSLIGTRTVDEPLFRPPRVAVHPVRGFKTSSDRNPSEDQRYAAHRHRPSAPPVGTARRHRPSAPPFLPAAARTLGGGPLRRPRRARQAASIRRGECRRRSPGTQSPRQRPKCTRVTACRVRSWTSWPWRQRARRRCARQRCE